MKISDQDRDRIAKAVARAEGGTSGEIQCVLADEAQDRRPFALSLAAGVALIGPAVAVLLGFRPQGLSQPLGHWSVGHLAAADEQALAAVGFYIVLQTAIFALVWALASWTGLVRALTPGKVLDARVQAAAMEKFQVLGLSHTRDRTGILLYVSLAEHRAHVLADEGIYAKAPHAVWDEVVGLLVAGLKDGSPADGFVAAVERTGQILASCLPPRHDDTNELPDSLVETRRR